MGNDVNEYIRLIAKRENISEHEVLEEMEKAIDAGYSSPDPKVQEYWAKMPFAQKPTPQELIQYLTSLMLSN